MAKKKTKKNNIKYGNVELDKDEFDSKYSKVRITTFIDLEVIESLKKSAKAIGIGYQTLLNEKLRDVILGDDSYQGRMNNIISRLENLEKKVG